MVFIHNILYMTCENVLFMSMHIKMLHCYIYFKLTNFQSLSGGGKARKHSEGYSFMSSVTGWLTPRKRFCNTYFIHLTIFLRAVVGNFVINILIFHTLVTNYI